MEINKEAYLANLPKKTGPNSERAYYIGLITDQINKGRIGTKWKFITPRGVAIKVSHLKTPDLKDHYYQCMKADNFSKCFWEIESPITCYTTHSTTPTNTPANALSAGAPLRSIATSIIRRTRPKKKRLTTNDK
jgi:hypothetical protein